ncbi:hypothetical protein YW7DRAFT_03108 [Streptomyces sp. AmelKG-E11A]|nr:hypothetical protein YW7DRAFT_03108 [Streptomyces sp. AmelKG-E11A]
MGRRGKPKPSLRHRVEDLLVRMARMLGRWLKG